ncbi:MAG: hypothetical protein HUU54_05740 [Ignavibacteriaceae bacterium]|nr:hypothetical protein [Ignavibacteriaceae bacterium]
MEINIHCVGILPIYFPFLLAVQDLVQEEKYKTKYKNITIRYFIRKSDEKNFIAVNDIVNNGDNSNRILHIVLSGLKDYSQHTDKLDPLMVLLSRVPLFGIADKQFVEDKLSKIIDCNNYGIGITPNVISDFENYLYRIYCDSTSVKFSTYGEGTTVNNYIKRRLNDQNTKSNININRKLLTTNDFGIDDLIYLDHNHEEWKNTVAFTINPWMRDKNRQAIILYPPNEFESFTNIFTEKYDKLDSTRRGLLNDIIHNIDKYITHAYLYNEDNKEAYKKYKDLLKEKIVAYYFDVNDRINSDNKIVKYYKYNQNDISAKELKHICMWLPGMKCNKINNEDIYYDHTDCCYTNDGINDNNINEAVDELIVLSAYYRIFGADYDVLAFPNEKERKTFHHDEKLKASSKAELLPQLSHAIGTEISASYNNMLMLYTSNKESLKRKTEFIGVIKNTLEVLIKKGKIHEYDLNKLDDKNWKDVKNIFKMTLQYLTEEDLKCISKVISICDVDEYIDYVNRFYNIDILLKKILFQTKKLYEIRETNRSILRMNSSESNIVFIKTGQYNIKKIIVSAIITALEHFYGNTIYPKSVSVENAYNNAKTRYWSKANQMKIELDLWKKHDLYLNEHDNIIEAYNNWYSEYSKCDTVFDIDISRIDDISFDTSEGRPIIEIFFQEIYLNAFKYGDNSITGKVNIILDVSGEVNINMFTFSNTSITKIFKKDGEGNKLVHNVLKNKFKLRPINKNYVEYDNNIYKITAVRDNEILANSMY